MSIAVKEKPGQKASVCSVAIVGLCLGLPPVSGNSRFVAVIATNYFGVNSHCVNVLILNKHMISYKCVKSLYKFLIVVEHSLEKPGSLFKCESGFVRLDRVYYS